MSGGIQQACSKNIKEKTKKRKGYLSINLSNSLGNSSWHMVSKPIWHTVAYVVGSLHTGFPIIVAM